MKATAYLTVKPTYSRYRANSDGSKFLESLTIEKVTQNRPSGGTFGAAVVKVTLDIPEHVFKPFEVAAEIEVKADQVGTIRAVVEPFQEEES